MNHVERFRAVMNFQPVDRLPRWEWAMWWDLTIAAWKHQGLPRELDSVFEIAEFFDLDPYQQFWFSTNEPTIDARADEKVAPNTPAITKGGKNDLSIIIL